MSHKSNSNTEEVMKELEKIAFKKGWIKPELQKQASLEQVKKDYTPTNSKEGDIIKLCAGLRDKGFHIEADVLEDNFLAFKKAENLYNIKTKSYEDYFKEAHPKSAEIAGYEVHDIYDVQESMLKAVEQKKKKAKLAAIAGLFKKADVTQYQIDINSSLRRMVTLLKSIGTLIVTDDDSKESSNAMATNQSCIEKADEINAVIKNNSATMSTLYGIMSFEMAIKKKWTGWGGFWKNDLSSSGKEIYQVTRDQLYKELRVCEALFKKIESENAGKTEEELQVQKELTQNEMKSRSETNSNKAKNLVRLKKLETRYEAIHGAITKDDTITKDPRWKKDYDIILKCFEIYEQTHTLLVTYVSSPTPIDQTRIDNKFTQVEAMLEKLAKAYM